MASTSASAGVVKVLVSFYRYGRENAFERHRSRIPIGKEQKNYNGRKEAFDQLSWYFANGHLVGDAKFDCKKDSKSLITTGKFSL